MNAHAAISTSLVGIGLYTPAEAGWLLQVAPGKISRWLRGHEANSRSYAALWRAQADMGEDGLFLGFRDLMEVRVAAAFILRGLSPQRVRRAIDLAREVIDDEHPLSTTRFRTDGRTVFLQVIEESGETRLLDLFKGQFAFHAIVERSLRDADYDETGVPTRWWPLGRAKSIVVDPQRSFGRPIEAETSVPVEVLANAAEAEGSAEAAARVWDVPVRAVRRAVSFRSAMDARQAA